MRARLALLALPLAAALGGCYIVPARPPEYAGEGPVPQGPPPPQVEVIPAAPSPLHVWIGGWWNWHLGRHVWIGGHWGLPPAPGHYWNAPRWNPGPRGWYFHRGYWGRRRG
jgi:hypothetical protein